jgi:hypothetical protein
MNLDTIDHIIKIIDPRYDENGKLCCGIGYIFSLWLHVNESHGNIEKKSYFTIPRGAQRGNVPVFNESREIKCLVRIEFKTDFEQLYDDHNLLMVEIGCAGLEHVDTIIKSLDLIISTPYRLRKVLGTCANNFTDNFRDRIYKNVFIDITSNYKPGSWRQLMTRTIKTRTVRTHFKNA